MSTTAATPTTGSAFVQSRLWGPRARDWAEVQEHQVTPLYETVLDRLGIDDGTSLLDAGCGAGLATQIDDPIPGRLRRRRPRTSGEDTVRIAVQQAIAPFRDQTGRYTIGSAFRYLIATA